MPSPEGQPISLVVVLGPTAVGKTGTAIELALRLDGEIISADSRLFYRGMDIGTAKPTLAERKGVPHHLIDIADPDEVWTLARFQRAAGKAIMSIHRRGRLPFLVGGTGQYIRGMIEGWEVPAGKPNLRLRAALGSWAAEVGEAGLHDRLATLDPEAAARIDPRNLRRTIRALEVILATGERFSKQRTRRPSPYRTFLLGLIRPRPELYARIDARIEAMLESGLIEEVSGLLERGFSRGLPSLSAIGYREISVYLRGEVTLEEAVRLIQRRTRQFVRRQVNWFKPDDPAIHWVRAGEVSVDELVADVQAFLRSA